MPLLSTGDIGSVNVDYVVVGGGTAGLTLAARLTEDPNVSVLVIEAGSYHEATPLIDIPALMGQAVTNPKYDWTFFSTPQEHANNRVILQPRGKGLGGSSLLNFMGMFRPSKEELDAIEILGSKGWNWDSFLKYLKKSETTYKSNLSPGDAKRFGADPDPAFHGTDGPIAKSLPTIWPTILGNFFAAAEVLGVSRNPDTSNGRNIGSMTSFASINPTTAKRSYATPAYLEPNIGRKNLLVLTDAQVTKLLLEDDKSSLKKAVGIEFIRDGERYTIGGVKKDVIISAGSLQTPQILELSGIGNQSILSKFGIKTEVDLPGVGENLQDHVGVVVINEVETVEETMDVLADPEVAQAHQELYKECRGLLTFVPAIGFTFLSGGTLGNKEDIKSWRERAHASYTESIAKAIPELKSGLEKQYKIQQQLISDDKQPIAEVIMINGHLPVPYSVPVKGKRYNSNFCILMHPLSRGNVHIISSDPLTAPAIDPNYFSNATDLDVIVHAVQFSLRLNNTSPMKECVLSQVVPSKEVLDRGEEGLKEYIKENCGPVYHPVGTASLLPREDGGVVDANLKVYGTSNIRVVDLSIIPLELACHTQAMAYAVGEKAADIIKSEYFRD
ncbi:alcohol oxidase [Pyrrhoderma noxium]|uniref:Alcohol oxidase n=1 Tax=Pyrrhoderma noxium TaxID=2282107 RepID=A0A286UPN1_9AGAM|nr:alcohol oxidase [Pyrrhoderma noxium]